MNKLGITVYATLSWPDRKCVEIEKSNHDVIDVNMKYMIKDNYSNLCT